MYKNLFTDWLKNCSLIVQKYVQKLIHKLFKNFFVNSLKNYSPIDQRFLHKLLKNLFTHWSKICSQIVKKKPLQIVKKFVHELFVQKFVCEEFKILLTSFSKYVKKLFKNLFTIFENCEQQFWTGVQNLSKLY